MRWGPDRPATRAAIDVSDSVERGIAEPVLQASVILSRGFRPRVFPLCLPRLPKARVLARRAAQPVISARVLSALACVVSAGVDRRTRGAARRATRTMRSGLICRDG